MLHWTCSPLTLSLISSRYNLQRLGIMFIYQSVRHGVVGALGASALRVKPLLSSSNISSIRSTSDTKRAFGSFVGNRVSARARSPGSISSTRNFGRNLSDTLARAFTASRRHGQALQADTFSGEYLRINLKTSLH